MKGERKIPRERAHQADETARAKTPDYSRNSKEASVNGVGKGQWIGRGKEVREVS